eukprot:scaffold5374_cov149-Skeletonema_menzelii.AAC.10
MVMVVLWRLGGFVRGGNGGRVLVRGPCVGDGRGWRRVSLQIDEWGWRADKLITSLLSRIVVL